MWIIIVTHNRTFSPNFPKFLWITLDPFISWTALIQGPIMVFKLILIGWRSRPIRDKDTFGPIPGCIYFVHIRNKAKSSILIGEFKHHSNLSDETACRKCFEQISCFCITLKCMVSHILWVISTYMLWYMSNEIDSPVNDRQIFHPWYLCFFFPFRQSRIHHSQTKFALGPVPISGNFVFASRANSRNSQWFPVHFRFGPVDQFEIISCTLL